jgi:zinc and cadmium transporter
MDPFISAILATTIVSLFSFVGIILLAGKFWNRRNEVRVVSFAAGVILAAAFLDLLPEAFIGDLPESWLFAAALGGMVLFFFLEQFIHRYHSHDDASGHHHHAEDLSASRLRATRVFVLFGDGLHNAIDGVAIAASFLVSTELGIVTTLAVIAHEIPHEVADYGILIRGGYSKRKALVYNFLSGLTAVAGALVTLVFQDFVEANLGYFIAGTAGMFLYIASANLIPELAHQKVKGRFLYTVPFLIGIATIALLLAAVPHGHDEEGAADDDHAQAYYVRHA